MPEDAPVTILCAATDRLFAGRLSQDLLLAGYVPTLWAEPQEDETASRITAHLPDESGAVVVCLSARAIKDDWFRDRVAEVIAAGRTAFALLLEEIPPWVLLHPTIVQLRRVIDFRRSDRNIMHYEQALQQVVLAASGRAGRTWTFSDLLEERRSVEPMNSQLDETASDVSGDIHPTTDPRSSE